MSDFRNHLARMLENPEFQKEYENLPGQQSIFILWKSLIRQIMIWNIIQIISLKEL